MKVLLANIPFIKYDEQGQIYTGPNSGSRWPWAEKGHTSYACFPFLLAYGTRYLRHHDVDADLYDGVALRHWDFAKVREAIAGMRPDMVVFDTSTPLYLSIREFGQWAKRDLGCRVVLVGPHMQTYAQEILRDEASWVDHCVIGEYEKPLLDIARDPQAAQKLYTFDHLEDLDLLGGKNFLPHRDYDQLHFYWDPSMQTTRVQLQVNTSRGCPFKCTYCQWPKVMNNGQYRNRKPEMVLDEIRTVIDEYGEYGKRFAVSGGAKSIARGLSQGLKQGGRVIRGKQSVTAGVEQLKQAVAAGHDRGAIGSIFFDDDTWNLGSKRMRQLCAGLKQIGLPWTMMGRTDVSTPELYDLMVDSGCVGMRFGVETFNQKLLDNVKKKMDGQKNYDTVKYLITRYSGMEFHFTTMKNLPGETDADWQGDLAKLTELQNIGKRQNNTVHWQNSDCVAFPGTEMWEEMVQLGKGEALRDFSLYDGNPEHADKLAEAVGWLGENYQAKWSKYSRMGAPTNLPRDTPIEIKPDPAEQTK